MKKIKFVLPVVVLLIALLYGFTYLNSTPTGEGINELPDWVVYVHPDGGIGNVNGAQVYIKLSGTNQFDSPKTTGSNGQAWFENNGSSFPDGYYEVRATKSGFGDGVTYVTISGGAPTHPRTNVTMGPAY